jgi:predicted deacetylase
MRPIHKSQARRSWLAPAEAALDAAAGPVEVFFRDDDAGWGDARLIELLDRFEAHRLPLDLAVIPAELRPALAAELRDRHAHGAAPLGLHQHGYAHVNHEPAGRKCEFGASRSPAQQRSDLEHGRALLAAGLGGLVDPIFTPPWNRCTDVTGGCLAELGFRVLSREARAEPLGIPGLRELPVSIDWFAHDHGVRLAPAQLGRRIAEAIGGAARVGVMFHHAVMDAAEMARADELLALIAGHENARATAMAELAGRPTASPCPPRARSPRGDCARRASGSPR